MVPTRHRARPAPSHDRGSHHGRTAQRVHETRRSDPRTHGRTNERRQFPQALLRRPGDRKRDRRSAPVEERERPRHLRRDGTARGSAPDGRRRNQLRSSHRRNGPGQRSGLPRARPTFPAKPLLYLDSKPVVLPLNHRPHSDHPRGPRRVRKLVGAAHRGGAPRPVEQRPMEHTRPQLHQQDPKPLRAPVVRNETLPPGPRSDRRDRSHRRRAPRHALRPDPLGA